MNLTDNLNILRDKHENDFKKIDMSLIERDNKQYVKLDLHAPKLGQGTYLFCLKDNTTEVEVFDWAENLIVYHYDVRRLNSALDDMKSNFRIQYKVISGKDIDEYSFIYRWDYRSVDIVLSLKSLSNLHKYLKTNPDLSELTQYNNLGDFISNYMSSDYIRNILEVNFNDKNIYDAMASHQLDKEMAIDKIKRVESKHGIVSLSSVIVSRALQILSKVNWVVDFESLDVSITFEEGCIFSTKDNTFIRDKAILDGILKLYKPDLKDIFE